MQGETAQPTNPPTTQEPQPSEADVRASVAREAERMTEEARELLHVAADEIRKPSVGGIIAGAAVLAAAATFGASEAAVAAIAGYAVFRMLRNRRRGAARREQGRVEPLDAERESRPSETRAPSS